MTNTLTSTLFASHGAGWPESGRPVRVQVDQALLDEDDGLVTLLAFESLGRSRHACALLLVAPAREPEGPDARADLAYLRTMAAAIGGVFVRPGAGPPAAVHRRGFAAPGRALLASAIGTPGAGALAMLVLEATPTETAAALAGDALRRERPPVVGVRLIGALRRGAGGAEALAALAMRLGGTARGAIVEYVGDVAALSMADRIAMASLGAVALGARASVFPSDAATRAWLAARGREADWRRLEGGEDGFDATCVFDLASVDGGVAGPGPVRFGPLAEDADLRALARLARAGGTLAACEVVVGGRAAHAPLDADGTLAALAAAGVTVRDAGDPRAQGAVEPDSLVCGDDAEVAAGRARAVSPAALAAHFQLEPQAAGEPESGVDTSALPDGEVLAPAPPGAAPAVERAAAHVPPEIGTPFAGSPRGVVLRADPGDVACEEVLGRGPRAHAARGEAAALAALSSRRADAGAAGRLGADGFAILAAAGRYGEGTGHDAAARATRALGVRVVLARDFDPAHARALAAQGVLPLRWRRAADAADVAAGDELEFTLVGEALARGRSVPVRALSRGHAFAAQVAVDEAWRDVAQAGGLLAAVARGAGSAVEG